ncbi:MAG: hypothetical protein Q4F11_05390 [Eubacteriales bacterium]|nr:hypothetical protein [Eubacteriales bacterium]
MIKKRLFKYGSVFMCAAVLACSFSVYASSPKMTAVTKEASAASVYAGVDSESIISEAISSQLAGGKKSVSSTTNSKEETVYVFADAKGAQDHILVNEKLKNVTGLSVINDVSKLKNITNVSGDETLATGADNALTWAAQGNSITYQGTTSQEAPVTMKVTYYLDGKEITPENLAGKSGKVRIRYDYVNNVKKTVSIDGKQYTVAVPFTMVTGMALPTDKFSNIEVTNGKISELSDSSVVLGITMPGLKDSLNLKLDGKTLDMDIPEYFELTADVTDFELDMSMSVATSNLLTDMDIDDISIDSLKSKMNELQTAADQLTAGSAALQEGTQTLADNVPALQNGTAQLADGLSQLTGQIPALTSGVSQLNEGAVSLSTGVNKYTDGVNSAAAGAVTLDNGAGELAQGINALADTFKNQIAGGVSEAYDGSGRLSAGIDKLQQVLNSSFANMAQEAAVYKANKAVLDSSMALQNQIGEAKPEALGGAAINQVLGNINPLLQIKTYDDLNTLDITNESAVTDLIGKYTKAYAIAYGIENSTDKTTQQYQLVAGINTVLSQYHMINSSIPDKLSNVYLAETGLLTKTISNGSIAGALNNVYTTTTTAKDSATGLTLAESLTALSDGARELNTGLNGLKAGIGDFNFTELPKTDTVCSALYKLKAGSAQLTGGTGTLSTGLAQLNSNSQALALGALQLKEGTSQLNSGASALADGSVQLSAGADKLNEAALTLGGGVSQLNEGAVTLKDGMAEFNETGIKALTSLACNDADTVVATLKAIVKAGQEYQSFGGKTQDMEGSVTFIYKTEGITK